MSYASCSGVLKVALGLGALLGIAVSASGCIEDADCGICDPDNLILESISGVNYTSDKIHLLSPPCEGDRCPSPFNKGSYFIEEIGPCEDTEDAIASGNAEEYCKISPLITAFGIEFVFNNLLDAQSVELVRKRPDNPQLFEVYDWKVDVLRVEGPITRWNGDYVRGAREEPDVMTRMVNLSCVDNLRAQGVNFGDEQYLDPNTNPCNDMVGNVPNKMFMDGEVSSYRGIWSSWGNSCSSPQEGPDTCCTFCEWLLTTKVERYGIDTAGVPRSPVMGAYDGDPARPYAPAIVCRTPEETADMITVVDTLERCREFIPAVDRSDEEQRWTYEWCMPGTAGPTCPTGMQTFAVPLPDKIRETHPDDRPRVDSKNRPFEKRDAATGGAFCRSTTDCSEVHGLSGTSCMGTRNGTENACLTDAYLEDGGCTPTGTGDAPGDIGGYCRPSWMAACADNADTVGSESAYCIDRRFATTGTGACKVTTSEVENIGLYGARTSANATLGAGFRIGCEEDGTSCEAIAGAGRELAWCDWNENGRLTGAECCTAAIAGPAFAGQDDGFACDPFYQSNLVDKPLYQRDDNLPEQTKNCKCPTDTSRSLEDMREELEDDGCFEAVGIGCFEGNSDDDADERMPREDRLGDYAVKFVTRVGGIVYDPAIKGLDWRPADTGGVPRADIEQCAMDNVDRLISPLNRHDGWRAQDPFTPENFEEFDRAMCSGQEYEVIFATPDSENSNAPYVVDKVGNTLEGKSVYRFETPQFHVVPGSGFPTDNLRIGACDDYAISFSNKYDVSPENLNKIQLYRLRCEGEGAERVCEMAAPDWRCDRDVNGDMIPDPPEGACCDPIAEGLYPPVAGGPGCFADGDSYDQAVLAGDACARPCLTVDVENQFIGEAGVEIDSTEFGQILRESEVYRMIIPAAGTLEEAASNPGVYDAVFWDVCGMPLVTANAIPYSYDFQIDEPKCKEDQDRDGIPFSCDNADTNFNPNQEDLDADSIGDVTDLCPVAGGDPNNTADSDSDGVGNICDTCRQTIDSYNEGADLAGVPAYLQVRNIPYQDDFDEDGIGDVCDNCVKTANCENFGTGPGQTPYRVADPIAYTDDDLCQRDTNSDLVGDVCFDVPPVGNATARIGFANDQDFDQDGVNNMLDKCPRQPILEADAIECGGPADCPENRSCDAGWCNHLDSDNDGVGNQCDTCPFSANPNQNLEGGMQEDDDDGDFVGSVCETAPACAERRDARPFGFFRAQANGNCCTTALVKAEVFWDNPDDNEMEHPENVEVNDLLLAGTCDSANMPGGATCTPLRAPHPEDSKYTLPVRTAEDCPLEQENGEWLCRQLRPAVAAGNGILNPPPGCEEALMTEDLTPIQNLLNPLTDDDFRTEADPFDALWQNMCFLPQTDQDYDGLGDPCDLCPFAYDPDNTQLIDVNGRLWPNNGAYCFGEYLPDVICEKRDEPPPGSEESGSGSGEESSGSGSGGSESGGGSGG
jgi:hypothetical protein